VQGDPQGGAAASEAGLVGARPAHGAKAARGYCAMECESLQVKIRFVGLRSQ
jgi:hypothetical protein